MGETVHVTMEALRERREEIRNANVKLCYSIMLFFVFLAIFTASMLLENPASSSRLADHLRAKFEGGPINLTSVTTVDRYYDFLEQVFIPAIYERSSTDVTIALTFSQTAKPIDISNRILGNVRLRQVRAAREEDCEVRPFEHYKIPCYPTYSEDKEDKQPFGPNNIYNWTKDEDGAGYGGKLASYDKNGYIQHLSVDRDTAESRLRALRQNGFLSAATRAVFIDFTVWSMNVGSYAAVRVVVEFAGSGTVEQTVEVRILLESQLVVGGLGTSREWLATLGVFTVMCFVMWFMYEEIWEIKSQRLGYLKDIWNIMDWVNMILLLAGFVIRVLIWVDAADLDVGEAAFANPNNYVNVYPLAENVQIVKLLNAFNAVLLWAKCVKYLRHLPFVKMLVLMVRDASRLLVPFLVMFLVAFVGFAMCYNIGFGDKIIELSTFFRTVVYLSRAYLRDVELMPVYHVTPLYGAFLILLFYVMLVLVAVNVLFAIMADAVYRAKYAKSRTAEEVYLHEDEPLEDSLRTLRDWTRRMLLRYVPPSFYMKVKRCRKRFMTCIYGKKPSQPGDPADSDDGVRVSPSQHQAAEKNASELAAIADLRRAYGSSDGSSTRSSMSMRGPTHAEVMEAIKHMSGRVLSEVQEVGIEIKAELHDVVERVAQMQMAVEELTSRVETVRLEQQPFL